MGAGSRLGDFDLLTGLKAPAGASELSPHPDSFTHVPREGRDM